MRSAKSEAIFELVRAVSSDPAAVIPALNALLKPVVWNASRGGSPRGIGRRWRQPR